MSEVSATIVVSVPFYDVDAMQVAWHGHYVKYMEQARCHLLDLLDYNYQQMQASGYVWPVVDLRIKYIKPLLFKQQVKIKVSLVESDYGMAMKFVFYDQDSGKRLTKAYSKQVAVAVDSGEMSLLSPPILQEKIAIFSNR